MTLSHSPDPFLLLRYASETPPGRSRCRRAPPPPGRENRPPPCGVAAGWSVSTGRESGLGVALSYPMTGVTGSQRPATHPVSGPR